MDAASEMEVKGLADGKVRVLAGPGTAVPRAPCQRTSAHQPFSWWAWHSQTRLWGRCGEGFFTLRGESVKKGALQRDKPLRPGPSVASESQLQSLGSL